MSRAGQGETRGARTARGPPRWRSGMCRSAYAAGGRRAVDALDIEVPAGRTLALVGPSGSGKTTIARLLLRFLDPDAGEIRVDGVPLGGMDADRWRRAVAWVPQQPHLFHGTIRDNLRLARPEAGEGAIAEALERAHADAFVRSLPLGLDTPVGERGQRLSGGEAQRIALARAFLKDAPLLVLDEPTAHLDPGYEAAIRESMAELRRGRTVLLIAHRLTTVADADALAVLSGGCVVEQSARPMRCGQPAAATRPCYARMEVRRERALEVRGVAPQADGGAVWRGGGAPVRHDRVRHRPHGHVGVAHRDGGPASVHRRPGRRDRRRPLLRHRAGLPAVPRAPGLARRHAVAALAPACADLPRARPARASPVAGRAERRSRQPPRGRRRCPGHGVREGARSFRRRRPRCGARLRRAGLARVGARRGGRLGPRHRGCRSAGLRAPARRAVQRPCRGPARGRRRPRRRRGAGNRGPAGVRARRRFPLRPGTPHPRAHSDSGADGPRRVGGVGRGGPGGRPHAACDLRARRASGPIRLTGRRPVAGGHARYARRFRGGCPARCRMAAPRSDARRRQSHPIPRRRRGGGRRPAGPRRGSAGTRARRPQPLVQPRGSQSGGPARREPPPGAGTAGGRGRAERRGQVHARRRPPAVLRRPGRVGPARWPRRPGLPRRRCARARLVRGSAREHPDRHDPGESAARHASGGRPGFRGVGDGGGNRSRGSGHPGAQPAGRVGHLDWRAGPAPVRRRTTAARAGARHPQAGAVPDPRRTRRPPRSRLRAAPGRGAAGARARPRGPARHAPHGRAGRRGRDRGAARRRGDPARDLRRVAAAGRMVPADARPAARGRHRRGAWRRSALEWSVRIAACHREEPGMGIMDFIKGELIDVIEWTDDSRDTLSYRFPDEDKAIKNGAQLIVRESQVVQFMYLGQFGDTFGPGKHTLTTDNIPVLTRLKSWKYGFNSPFKADVYYVNTRLFTGQQVGHGQSHHGARRRLRHRAAARVRHLRLQDRRAEAVPEGGRRIGPELPARRVRRHDAVAHGQRVQRGAGRVAGPGARRRHAVHGTRRGAAAAHQPGGRDEVRPRDHQLHRRERVGAAGGRGGDRQALEHGRRRQPERLREVPDGRRAWKAAGRAPAARPPSWPSASAWRSR